MHSENRSKTAKYYHLRSLTARILHSFGTVNGYLCKAEVSPLAGSSPSDGHELSETFLLRQDAEAWARRAKCEIDSGKTPTSINVAGVKTFGGLIDLHQEDMKSVSKQIGRSALTRVNGLTGEHSPTS